MLKHIYKIMFDHFFFVVNVAAKSITGGFSSLIQYLLTIGLLYLSSSFCSIEKIRERMYTKGLGLSLGFSGTGSGGY